MSDKEKKLSKKELMAELYKLEPEDVAHLVGQYFTGFFAETIKEIKLEDLKEEEKAYLGGIANINFALSAFFETKKNNEIFIKTFNSYYKILIKLEDKYNN
jgi:hypothetical protein